jgi:hypothetical protein
MVVLSVLPLGAQEPVPKKPAENATPPADKKAYDPARRVPSYFGDLGLTAEQREAIYKIRGKHLPQVVALKKQLAELDAAIIAECEAVLTDAQKESLATRRRTAAETKKARAEAKRAAQSAKNETKTPK